MSARVIEVLPDAEGVARRALAAWRSHAHAAVASRGAFRVLLSGGSTPRRLFQLLAAPDVRDTLPWQSTQLFWGDERCVPPDHADSNYRMTRETLLDVVGPPADRVHRLEGERSDLDAAARDYQAAVARAFAIDADGPPPRFDLVLLGMGADAHTASLFPSTRALGESRRWVVANDVPQLATRRLTATYPLLDAARSVMFLAAGADKAPALSRVLAAAGDPTAAPARGVAPAGTLEWVVDRAAAAGIPADCPYTRRDHAG
jgi:6-phosphogluconolactonase